MNSALTQALRVNIVFEKEFSQLSIQEQKQLFSKYLIQAVGHVAKRLERKISYGFTLMIDDFKSILDFWRKTL